MTEELTDVEHAKKYAEESISLAISMSNPEAENIAKWSCLYGLTYKNDKIKELQEENEQLKIKLDEAKEIIKMLHSDCYSITECEDTNLGLWEDDLAKAEAFINKKE